MLKRLLRSQFWCYGVAVFSVAIALVLTLLLQSFLYRTIFALFYAAVTLSAYYGGMRAGLLATLLSTLSIAYFFVPPASSLSVSLGNILQMGVFVLVTTLINSLNNALRIAKRRSESNLQQLKASEERYRVLAENVPQLVWFANAEGAIEYFNQRWYDYTGLTPLTSLEWEWQRAIDPNHLRGTLKNWTTGLATGNPVEIQYLLKRADGVYRWHITRAVPLRDFHGEITHWFGTCTDIHDQKQAEEELRQSQTLLDAFLANAPIGFAFFDSERRYARINPSLAALNQMPAAEILGKTVWDVLDPDLAGTVDSRIQQVLETGEPILNVEENGKALALPEQPRYCLSSYYPLLSPSGEILGVGGAFVDMSDRKQAEAALHQREQQLKTLLENIPDIIARFDRSLRHLYVSPVIEQVTGIAPESFLGKTGAELGFPQEICQLWKTSLEQVFATRHRNVVEFTVETLDGLRYYHTRLVPEFTEDGSVCSVLSIARDLTDFKRAERERMRLLEELESKQKLLETVLQQMPAGLAVAEAPWGRLLLVNDQVQQILPGVPVNLEAVEEYVQPLYPLFHPDGRRYEAEEFPLARSLRTGEIVSSEELEVQLPDGIRKTLLVDASPIRNDQGEIEAAVTTFYDISDRKRIETALRESEARLRLAQEAANAGLWDWDIVTNQVTWSEQYYRLYGLDLTTPPSYENWLTSIVEQDRERVEQGIRQALEHRGELNVEFRTLHPTQGVRWIAAIGKTFYNALGQPERMSGIALDITNRKQSEEALLQSEERFRQFAENIQDVFWMVDSNLEQVLYINPAYEQLWGRSCENLYTNCTEWIEVIHPDDRERVRTAFQNRVLEGEFDEEYRIVRPDGSIRWIRDRGVPVKDESDKIYRVVGIAEDITRKKQDRETIATLNQDLQRRVNELQTLFEVIPIAIAIAQDPQCHYIRVNPTLAKIIGISTDANASSSPPSGAPLPSYKVYYQGQLLLASEMPVQYAAAHGMEVRDTEIDIVREDGAAFNLFGYASPLFDEQGRPRGAVGAFLDITERKLTEAALRESEERFRVAQEISLDAFTILQSVRNASGEIVDFEWTYVNPKAAAILQHPVEDLIGGRLLQLLPGNKENSELFDRYLRVVETGEPHDLELRYNSEGIEGWFRNMAVKLGDGVAVSFTDITERKQQEAERLELLEREQTARAQAESANRIKDEFLAVLSHELRSPLNPILGWSKLLRSRKFEQATAERALETIERNAKLQAQLIEDLLDVSRILRGKLSLNICPVNLGTVIESAIETVRLSADAKSIQIETKLDFNIEPVLGDSNRLQQIIWNLVSNAIKFTPDGGRVEVRLEKLQIANSALHIEQEKLPSQISNLKSTISYAVITVSDTGKGISPAFLPYVFDYFRQADSSTTRTFGGLGLGLAIVRHLVELHGGTVYAESPGEEQGATFTVRLPLMRESNGLQEQGGRGDNTLPNPQCPIPLNGLQVLAVDDDEDMCEYIAFVLEQAGAKVTLASSADEAMEIIQQSKVDILLSDIGMPNVDGYMLMQQVRSLKPDRGGQIRAIALTAYAGDYDQRKAFAAGFQMHVPKPVEPNRLIEAIVSLMGNG